MRYYIDVSSPGQGVQVCEGLLLTGVLVILGEGCRGRREEVLHGGAASSEPLDAQMLQLSTLWLCTFGSPQD